MMIGARAFVIPREGGDPVMMIRARAFVIPAKAGIQWR